MTPRTAQQPDTFQTLTPTPGKQGTRVDRKKYDVIRKALRRVIPKSKQGVPFKELPRAVAPLVPKELFPKGVSWYVTVVKLDMEARGEIERIEGSKPQRVRRLK